MHEYELRHVLGDRIYDAFQPRGMLYQHDAEDYDNLAVIGTTDEGEVVEINKRAADSDLIVYANVNQVAMDGGWKSITTGLASYRCLSFHHNPETLQNTRSLMGHRDHSALHKSIWRMGKVLRDQGPKIFQIETTINTDAFPVTVRLPAQARVGVDGQGPGDVPGDRQVAQPDSRTAPSARSSTPSRRPTRPPVCRPGSRPSVHEITLENVYHQHLVQVEGQTDILTMGIPFICPYNPDGIMNPILVMCMGLGYLFNMYRSKPLVREGGVVIMTHPTYREFNPVHHPSYIDFFDEVLADTTDPAVMSTSGRSKYAEDEWYRHLYRTGNAYHGVHPFYAWYWGAHGQQWAGQGDHRRRRPADRAPARLHPGEHDGRRVRDRQRRRRPLPDHQPPPRPGVLVADVK